MAHKTWAQRNPSSDPVGPGSPAWNSFDRALSSLRSRDYRRANMYKGHMVTHLNFAGRSDLVAPWYEALYYRAFRKTYGVNANA